MTCSRSAAAHLDERGDRRIASPPGVKLASRQVVSYGPVHRVLSCSGIPHRTGVLRGRVRTWCTLGHRVLVMSRSRSALEEQRSEKYRHALIAVVSIGVRAGQLGGTDAWLSSHLVSHT